ncbi:MAG TPA: S8 family serine peptidase [Thermoanaerobaculia bacterium]|nr:S8 family serine peptidase [Thermoanaerobaculia bacterium]
MKRISAILCFVLSFFLSSALGATVNRAERSVPGEYIIALKEGVPAVSTAFELAGLFEGEIITTYAEPLPGFAIRLPLKSSEELAMRLAADPRVAMIEENAIALLADSTIVGPPEYPNLNLWHVDRIDQVSLGSARLDDSYSYATTGSGVRIYVVDSGVRPDHAEFQGRVDPAPDLQQTMLDAGLSHGAPCWESIHNPESSHGTSVASVAAGKKFGVARMATIVDARAFNCFGDADAVHINKVLEWIIQDPNRQISGTSSWYPSVVNLSFAFSKYEEGMTTTNAWIDTLVNTYNIKVVSAAGNIPWAPSTTLQE